MPHCLAEALRGVAAVGRPRRIRLISLCLVTTLIAGLAALQSQAQPNPPAVDAVPGQAEEPSLASDNPTLFVGDRAVSRKMTLVERRIAAQAFDEAVELLQSVIDADNDSLIPGREVPGADASAAGVEGAKQRAYQVLHNLSPQGKRSYELKYGLSAAQRLAEALKANRWDEVAEIARRYRETAAGAKAMFRLAARAHDRGEYLTAVTLLSKLSPEARRALEPEASLRLATAYHALGEFEAEQSHLKEAARWQGKGSVALRLLTDPNPRASRSQRFAQYGPTMWPYAGGQPNRVADPAPSTPSGGAVWHQQSTVALQTDLPEERSRINRIGATVRQQLEDSKLESTLRLPAFQPLIVDDLLIVRTLADVRAFDLATGEVRWIGTRADDGLFERATTDLADVQAKDIEGAGSFLRVYSRQRAWRDQATASLSSDGRHVFAIEGVGVASYGPQPVVIRPGRMPLHEASDPYNRLVAYDLASEGRIGWIAGGPIGETNPLAGSFIFGPPLPLGGSLYLIAESQGEIRLDAFTAHPAASGPQRIWSQPLVRPEIPVEQDQLRKLSGISPTFGEGVLICPTEAGAVIGVDPFTRTLLWGYQYQRRIPQRQGRTFGPIEAVRDDLSRWLDAVPQIASGCLLLTPRDSDELHCLDPQTGQVLWTKPREDRLYVATVSDDRVIVVGREKVEAFHVLTGESAWSAPITISKPAGRGVVSGRHYYLTLESGELATLDLTVGKLVAQAPLSPGLEGGNLVAAGGQLVLQNVFQTAAFAPLPQLELQIERRLAQNPEDPIALAWRGERLLHQGQVAQGLNDLQQAARSPSAQRAREIVVMAFLAGLKSDFASYRSNAEQIRPFATSAAQRAEFSNLLARGLASHGEPFEAIVEFARLVRIENAMSGVETVTPSLYARQDRALRPMVQAAYGGSSREVRSQIDAFLQQTLDEILADRTAASPQILRTLERFRTLFHDLPIGTVALQALIERDQERSLLAQEGLLLAMLARPDNAPFRSETERRLQSLLSRTRSAFAHHDLVPSRPGAEAAVTDDSAENTEPNPNRETSNAVPPERAESENWQAEFVPDGLLETNRRSYYRPAYAVHVSGSRPDELNDWYFEIDSARENLVGVDGQGRKHWSVPLTSDSDPTLMFSAIQVQFSGHLMLVVMPNRLIVFDILTDPRTPHFLWQRDLMESSNRGINVGIRMAPQMFPGGRQHALAQDVMGRPLGRAGFAGPELLLYQQGTSISAVNPVTGELLWKHKEDMLRGCDLTGDDQTVILQPPDSNEALIVRAADGMERTVVKTGDPAGRVTWIGTRLVTWESSGEANGKWWLLSSDLSRDGMQPEWKHSFPATTKLYAMEDHELGLLDQQGNFAVVDLETGDQRVTAFLPEAAESDDFLTLRAEGRYLLMINRRSGQMPPGVRMEPGNQSASVNGGVFCFQADDGRLKWKTALGPLQFSAQQPVELPTLYFYATFSSRNGNRYHQIVLLDQQTGKVIFDQSRVQSVSLPQEIRLDPVAGKYEYVIDGGRIVISGKSVTSGVE